MMMDFGSSKQPQTPLMAMPKGAGVDEWLESLKKGNPLPERELRQLCERAKEVLIEENNLQPVSAPVIICGDIHGQFHDLIELFNKGGHIPDSSYIFMGDLVDRGFNSVETFQLLMCLKVKYPQHITLLRGNHESRTVSSAYGFYDENFKKYGNVNPWKYCTDVFDYMCLAACVEGEILCVHGGLSPEIKTFDQIRAIDRKQEMPHDGPFSDLMWSDPEEIETWAMSPRGAGWLFGSKVTTEFCNLNGIKLITRSHQLVQEGYKFHFRDENVVTVWSAPNYCYRCANVASILKISDTMQREFEIFHCVPDQRTLAVDFKTCVPYFL